MRARPDLLGAMTHSRSLAEAAAAAYYLDFAPRNLNAVNIEAMHRQFGLLAAAMGYRVIPLAAIDTADEAETVAA